MKRMLMVGMALSMLTTACTGGQPMQTPQPTPGPVELIVFAAASTTEALTEIATSYENVAPHVQIVYTFDSSGTLKTQIEEGADCDLFLSAGQRQMNDLGAAIQPETRRNLLENQIVLTVPKGNPAGVIDFADVNTDKVSLLALGNADVPVGQYAQELFENLGFWEEIQDKITVASNVKEVTIWVTEEAVDCGVVYRTDASAAGLEVVATAPAELLLNPVHYPAALLADSQHPTEAQAFLDYLQATESAAIWEEAGFSVLKQLT